MTTNRSRLPPEIGRAREIANHEPVTLGVEHLGGHLCRHRCARADFVRANGVYPIFSNAGRLWLSAQSVYAVPTVVSDVFRYSPPVAAFFAPLSLLRDSWGGLIWRAEWLAFFGGLAAWCRWQRPARDLAAMALLVLPLAMGGLNSGQCNALIIGSLLLAQVAFTRGFWTTAAVLVTIPTLFKGYPLAFGMLLCLVEPAAFHSAIGGVPPRCRSGSLSVCTGRICHGAIRRLLATDQNGRSYGFGYPRLPRPPDARSAFRRTDVVADISDRGSCPWFGLRRGDPHGPFSRLGPAEHTLGVSFPGIVLDDAGRARD